MSWTDERVELLRKLWLDGLSASTIAREMGGAITRNAVIGKVHRMGLAGRSKTPAELPVRAKPKPMTGMPGAATSINSAPRATPGLTMSRPSANIRPSAPMVSGNNALAMALSPMVTPAIEPKLQTVEEVVIPMTERVTIMELREAMCKWPLGDPMNSDFRYCGAKAPLGGAPYCTSHSQIAYQPTQDRRARDRKQLRIG